jgi:hypothetical protein
MALATLNKRNATKRHLLANFLQTNAADTGTAAAFYQHGTTIKPVATTIPPALNTFTGSNGKLSTRTLAASTLLTIPTASFTGSIPSNTASVTAVGATAPVTVDHTLRNTLIAVGMIGKSPY